MVVGSPAYHAPEALDDSYGSDEEGDADTFGSVAFSVINVV
jgi:hypothetical protein